MKTLHRALQAIRRAAMGHKDPHWSFFDTIGICHHVQSWMRHYVSDTGLRDSLDVYLGTLIAEWEKDHHVEGKAIGSTTNRSYPVGGCREYEHGDLWANPRRWQLLAYLLERTR